MQLVQKPKVMNWLKVINCNVFRQCFIFLVVLFYFFFFYILLVCVYKYSHQSNGNSVYYLQAYDYAYNRYVLNEFAAVVAAPDV